MNGWSHPVDAMPHRFLHQLYVQVHFRPDRYSLVPHTHNGGQRSDGLLGALIVVSSMTFEKE